MNDTNDFDLNYYDSLQLLGFHSAQGTTRVDDDKILVHSGMNVPALNSILITDRQCWANKPWRGCGDFFKGGALGHHVVLPDALSGEVEPWLFDDGYTFDSSSPAMVFDSQQSQLKKPAIYDQLDIQIVNTPTQYEDFKRVVGPAYQMPSFLVDNMVTDAFVRSNRHTAYIGYWQGEVVSTSILFITHGVAGIYWVATEESYRGKGLGEALTFHAAQKGLEQVDRFVSLQASESGAPVYTRMGFETLYHYKSYTKKADAKN